VHPEDRSPLARWPPRKPHAGVQASSSFKKPKRLRNHEEPILLSKPRAVARLPRAFGTRYWRVTGSPRETNGFGFGPIRGAGCRSTNP